MTCSPPLRDQLLSSQPAHNKQFPSLCRVMKCSIWLKLARYCCDYALVDSKKIVAFSILFLIYDNERWLLPLNWTWFSCSCSDKKSRLCWSVHRFKLIIRQWREKKKNPSQAQESHEHCRRCRHQPCRHLSQTVASCPFQLSQELIFWRCHCRPCHYTHTTFASKL
jgi:hypothetical protein